MLALIGVLLAALLLAPAGAEAQVLAYPSSGVAGLVANNCVTTTRLLYLASTGVANCSTLSYDGTDVTLASGQLIVPNSASATLAHSGDTDTGMGFPAAGDRIAFFAGDGQRVQISSVGTFGGLDLGLSSAVAWGTGFGSQDLYLSRQAAANLLLGATAANPPVAQTLSTQGASGTNIAGANFTVDVSQGTGTGAGGSFIVRTAAAGGTGSSQNALATALTIDSAKLATFAGQAQVTPPAAQTIAATNTITADACGSIKRVTAAGAVTTNTTDTFTAPAAANAGCIMYVVNVGANTITLDNNANFVSPGAADVSLGPNDAIIVGSTGASGAWYALSALVAN